MKKLFAATICLVAMAFGAEAQTAAPVKSGAMITVNKDTHDYGEIKQGADPYCAFTVKNTGNAPLIISNAVGSCGCTVPEWSKEPVMPGKTTVIKVKYDTNRVGPINKSVTLTTNADNEPTMVLKIKGNISAVAQETAPVKAVPAGAPVNK
jgi:hypothetical protein